MTQPPYPHEPHDADEQALARVLRALPAAGPSPALDQRILKAAQDAIAATSQQPRRARAGARWGWGTAAAAVLALGISWQLRQGPGPLPLPGSAPTLELQQQQAKDNGGQPPLAMPIDASAASGDDAPMRQDTPAQQQSRQAAEADALREQILARESERKQGRAESAPPRAFADAPEKLAKEASALGQTAAAPVVVESLVAEPVPEAPPAPPAPSMAPPAPVLAEPVMEMAAPAADMAAPAAKAVTSSAATNDRDAVGYRDAQLDPISSDQRLPAGEWLRKIQQRIDRGDVAGARASLALLRAAHPELRIPRDVTERLRE